MSRSDHRSRPQTSPATMHYDDKTPFLTHTAQIGRNFDEDERKPLDGISAPRRTVSDESIRVSPSRVEVKPEYGVERGSFGAPVSQTSVGTVNSYSTRLTEGIHVGVNSHNLGGGIQEQGTASVHPNVWAMRKEVASVVEPEQSVWSGPNAVSKLAHASAIEKVSSGRWQSKTVHYQTDIEVLKSSEVESASLGNVNGNNAYNRMDTAGNKEYHDALIAKQIEKGLVIDDQMQGGRNDLLDYGRSGVSKYSEARSRSVAYRADGVQLDGKLSGSELQQLMPAEPTERPKLKLLPRRTKPLDNTEPSGTGYVQVFTRSTY